MLCHVCMQFYRLTTVGLRRVHRRMQSIHDILVNCIGHVSHDHRTVLLRKRVSNYMQFAAESRRYNSGAKCSVPLHEIAPCRTCCDKRVDDALFISGLSRQAATEERSANRYIRSYVFGFFFLLY